jgi:hypothetical protein
VSLKWPLGKFLPLYVGILPQPHDKSKIDRWNCRRYVKSSGEITVPSKASLEEPTSAESPIL